MWPHGCSGRRRPRPPARLGDLTSFGAAPRSPPVPSGPSGALHTSGARPSRRPWAPQPGLAGLAATPSDRPGCSAISHVIPLRVFQTLKSLRWNCNVLRGSRKLTVVNYVRLLLGVASWPRRTDNVIPLADHAGSVMEVRQQIASTAPRPRMRRRLRHRASARSSRAGWLGAGST